MDSKFAHEIYTQRNNDGNGFPLTELEDALVVDEIAAAGLTIVADHGNGLLECRDGDAVVLVGGDGSRRNAWAVIVPSRLLTPTTGAVYAAAADLYAEVA